MLEMEDLIKNTMRSVGHYTILAYELENEKLQLASLDEISKTPIIMNKIRNQEQIINEMTEKVNDQENTVIQGITQITDKYREAFSFGLGEVREGIEDAMAKFGSTISKDTLAQINKESTAISGRLSTFTDQQQKRISTVADDMKTKIRHFDHKYDQLKETADKHSKVVDRLSAANTNSIQKITNISTKLQTLNKTQDELQGKLDNELEQLNKRISDYKKTMETVSEGLAEAVKGDMEYLSSKMKDAQKVILDDRKTLKNYKSDFISMRQQLMPLLRSTTTATTPSSSSSSSSSSTTSTTSINVSNVPDSEVIEIKSSIKQMERKLKEVQQIINVLTHDDESPSLTTIDKSTFEEVPKRLDDLERYMIYILTKVDLMEPRYCNKKHTPTSPRGTKRQLEVSSDAELSLLSEIRRVEFKLANLIDFIHQFRSSILDPSFPEKLDGGLQRFEASLMRHEIFIGYLVDPQATMKRIMMNSSTDVISKGGEQSQQQSPLTPALLSTIAQFIADEMDKSESCQSKKQKTIDTQQDKQMVECMKQMMAEHVDPLKKKIEDLEKQLQQKEQHK